MGGLSYSEIHYAKSVSSQVILGGSVLLSPRDFLRELRVMSSKVATADGLQLDLEQPIYLPKFGYLLTLQLRHNLDCLTHLGRVETSTK
jgi:hypothetical protein